VLIDQLQGTSSAWVGCTPERQACDEQRAPDPPCSSLLLTTQTILKASNRWGYKMEGPSLQ